MRLCRFNDDRLGVLDEAGVYDVSDALDALPATRWPAPLGDPLIAHLPALRARIGTVLANAPRLQRDGVVLRSPIANPSKIIGAPVNYKAHAEEIDDALRHGHAVKPIAEWGLFLKANSALCGPDEGVRVRFPERRTDHEVELAVVIGQGGSDIARDDAMNHIAGYAVALDITLRGPEFQSFRKSIDSYAVLGPCLVTADAIADPGNLEISLRVNDVQRQCSTTANLLWDVPQLIAFASRFYTLFPGDIVMTGSPEGVGPIVPGDVLHAEIAGIGAMSVRVGAHA